MFEMRFASLKCRIALQDWTGSKPSLFRAENQLGEVDRFSCLSSFISSSGRISDGTPSHMQKTLFVSVSLA